MADNDCGGSGGGRGGGGGGKAPSAQVSGDCVTNCCEASRTDSAWFAPFVDCRVVGTELVAYSACWIPAAGVASESEALSSSGSGVAPVRSTVIATRDPGSPLINRPTSSTAKLLLTAERKRNHF